MTPDELKSKFFSSYKFRFEKCLYPLEECVNQPINAHSIQNSNSLDRIQENGHVIGIDLDTSVLPAKPKPKFKKIGRNKASTFTGLCAVHDNLLFKPIDTELNISDTYHLYLLTYRSILKELHSQHLSTGRIISSGGERLFESYASGSPNQNDQIRMGWIVNLMETVEYVEKIEDSLRNKQFDFLRHQVIVINHDFPTIVCSQLFSADSIKFNDDVLRICLTLFPINNKQSLALFSTTKEESGLMNSYLERVIQSSGVTQKYELSKMIIRNVENFYLSPRYYKGWSNDKSVNVLDYYSRSAFSDFDEDNSDYYLFS